MVKQGLELQSDCLMQKYRCWICKENAQLSPDPFPSSSLRVHGVWRRDSPVHVFGSGNWSDRYRLGIGRLFIEIYKLKPWNISVNAPINVLPQVPPHGQRVGIWPIWNQLPLPPEQILWSNAVSMNFDQIPLIWSMFITPRACARGKVISFVCRLSA